MSEISEISSIPQAKTPNDDHDIHHSAPHESLASDGLMGPFGGIGLWLRGLGNGEPTSGALASPCPAFPAANGRIDFGRGA